MIRLCLFFAVFFFSAHSFAQDKAELAPQRQVRKKNGAIIFEGVEPKSRQMGTAKEKGRITVFGSVVKNQKKYHIVQYLPNQAQGEFHSFDGDPEINGFMAAEDSKPFGVIRPPGAGKIGAIYNSFGSKDCSPKSKLQKDACQPIAWPSKGEDVTILSGVRTGGKTYYYVEYYDSETKEITTGYVQAEDLWTYPGDEEELKSMTSTRAAPPKENVPETTNPRIEARPELDVTNENLKEEAKKIEIMNPLAMNPACTNFIGKDGKIGGYGQEILKQIQNDKEFNSCFNDLDLSFVCPNFKSFGPQRRNQFVAFLSAAISHHESGCGGQGLGITVNGIKRPKKNSCGLFSGEYKKAIGLFMLEKDYCDRKDTGRSEKFCGPTNHPEAVAFQSRCFLSIFESVYCSPKKQIGKYRGYWEELNPGHRGLISKKLMKFPGCLSHKQTPSGQKKKKMQPPKGKSGAKSKKAKRN